MATRAKFKLQTINKFIQKNIHPEWELVKGDGYFYFVGPGSEYVYSASVYVPRLNDLPLSNWFEIAEKMFDEATAKMG